MKTAARFASNTFSKPVDRRRALGFAPGLKMSMNPRGSNLPGYDIPQGQLIIFNPRIDGFLKDKYKTVVGKTGERLLSYDGSIEYSGRHFADAVAAKFQGGKVDFGFRILECLNDLDYDIQTGYDQADDYFATLHPRLTCEMGLEEPNPRGPAGDLINKGEPLPCPTCRLKWLNSTECQEAIFNSALDHNRLEQLRQTLVSSYEAGIQAAKHFLGKVQSQIEAKNSAKTYQDTDYHFMKMLHKKAPHVEQAEIQSEAARIQGEAIGKSVAEAIQATQAKAEAEEAKQRAEELERKVKELEAQLKEKKAK